MPWPGVPLDQLQASDLRALVESAVSEARALEFKLDLPGHTDGAQKEFLADVTSFANTIGGFLVFGIEEANGIAMAAPGVALPNPDAEVQRLESIIRSGVNPRISGVAIRAIPITSDRSAVVIRTPRSWAAPHMVTLAGSSRFFARNSSGKYPLDVHELRSAFLIGETTGGRIRDFRLDRLAKIKANETPIGLDDDPKVVLHFAPITAFEGRARIDLSSLHPELPGFAPLSSTRRDHRVNFDGLLVYPNRGEGRPVHSYLQIFRDGSLETVSASMLRPDNELRFIRSLILEREVMESLAGFVALEQAIGMEPPYVAMLSLLGVKGYRVMPGTPGGYESQGSPIDRSDLLLSDVLIEDALAEPHRILQPIFDEVWNAAGWRRSLNYRTDGTYSGH
jgi:Schlafen, AlbA_2